MHRALLITELLEAIFGYLHEGWDGAPEDTGNGTLPAVTRTCRAFKEPALDALWADILTLDPLIKCLPKDAWKLTDEPVQEWMRPHLTATPIRPLGKEDWAILRKYTPKVRHLGQIAFVPFCSDALWELSLTPDDMHPLLPNLKSLNWAIMPPEDRPHMRMLLPSSLEYLFYMINCSDADKRDTSVLFALGDLCPLMKRIDCPWYSSIEGGVEAFSHSVCRWKNLETLRCERLTDEAMVHIAGLSTMRDLVITLSPETSFRRLRSKVPERPFVSLAYLELNLSDLDLFVSFATEMNLSLVEVTLSVVNNFCTGRVRDAFAALAKGKLHLKTIHLFESDDEAIPIRKDPPFEPRGLIMSIMTLEPLFKFHKLRILDVNVQCGVVIDDKHLIEIARFFPLLETLKLNASWGWELPALVTFYGLFSLLYLCPHLIELGLEFNAVATEKTDPPENAPSKNRFPQTPPNAKISTFIVGNSKIEDPVAVAKLLHGVMPNLNKISSWDGKYRRPNQDEWNAARNKYAKRWNKVARILGRPHPIKSGAKGAILEFLESSRDSNELDEYADDDAHSSEAAE